LFRLGIRGTRCDVKRINQGKPQTWRGLLGLGMQSPRSVFSACSLWPVRSAEAPMPTDNREVRVYRMGERSAWGVCYLRHLVPSPPIARPSQPLHPPDTQLNSMTNLPANHVLIDLRLAGMIGHNLRRCLA
jgi:hypothetical protein